MILELRFEIFLLRGLSLRLAIRCDAVIFCASRFLRGGELQQLGLRCCPYAPQQMKCLQWVLLLSCLKSKVRQLLLPWLPSE